MPTPPVSPGLLKIPGRVPYLSLKRVLISLFSLICTLSLFSVSSFATYVSEIRTSYKAEYTGRQICPTDRDLSVRQGQNFLGYENNIEPSGDGWAVAIFDEFTAPYDPFASGGGTLSTVRYLFKIVPRHLTVSTPSIEKQYDGQPYTATEGATIEGLLPEDQSKVHLVVTGSQTEPGTSTNTYELRFDDESIKQHYDLNNITENLGTIKVDKRLVTKVEWKLVLPTIDKDSSQPTLLGNVPPHLIDENPNPVAWKPQLGTDFNMDVQFDYETGEVNITVHGIGAHMEGESSGSKNVLSVYEVLEGASQSWRKGSATGPTFKLNGNFNRFSKLFIDDQLVDPSNYLLAAGSTFVTLKPEYANSLSEGSHNIYFAYDDNHVTSSFEILPAPTPNPAEETPSTKPATATEPKAEAKLSKATALPQTSDLVLPVGAVVVVAAAVLIAARLLKK